ncbi:hypothetical protein F4777DRAFT_403872 [Nemania sp. FL0916]|nr:hypothetical protein F4777DRAFT_403872 [Nemania sp. FL0916]
MKKLRELRITPNAASERFSNADIVKFFEDNIEGWGPTELNVGAVGNRILVEMIMENATLGNIRIQLFLGDNFQDACWHLFYSLSCFSGPIDVTFPITMSKPGEIRLEMDRNESKLTMLWAYHNVFVISSIWRPDTMTPPEIDASSIAFYSVANKLFQHIRDGCVLMREGVSSPKVLELNAPVTVHRDEAFVVDVAVDRVCFYDVKCTDNKTVLAAVRTIGSVYS